MAEIHYLVDYPHFLPIIAFWNYREWHLGKQPFDEIIDRYRQRLQKGKIPTTLIAIEDTMPVGSVSIKENDLIERLTGTGRELRPACSCASFSSLWKQLGQFGHSDSPHSLVL